MRRPQLVLASNVVHVERTTPAPVERLEQLDHRVPLQLHTKLHNDDPREEALHGFRHTCSSLKTGKLSIECKEHYSTHTFLRARTNKGTLIELALAASK
jgi:hypothetical protein